MRKCVKENVDKVRGCGRGITGEGFVSTIFNTGVGRCMHSRDAFAVPGTPTFNAVNVDDALSACLDILVQQQ